jgi:hypothetical protein
MRRASSLLSSLVFAFAATGCGGDDGEQKLEDLDPGNRHFHTAANADVFAGPPPLRVQFRADAFRASGPVHYRWKFDDGTFSQGQTPTHTFTKPGSYGVIMDARTAETNDRQTLILGVWPRKVWERAGRIRLTGRFIRRVQQDQRDRTARRKLAQINSARRRALE